MAVHTKIAYNFKSHTWVIRSLIRRPVLDLELDITILKLKLNFMSITITLAVLYISQFSLTLFFSSYCLYFFNNLFRF